MLGAIVYILQAEEDGWLPEFTGRIMHGAMFQILKEKSQELAEFIHNDMNIKPFTVSELNRCQDNKKSGGSYEEIIGNITKIDEYKKNIIINNIKINFNDIIDINSDEINDIVNTI